MSSAKDRARTQLGPTVDDRPETVPSGPVGSTARRNRGPFLSFNLSAPSANDMVSAVVMAGYNNKWAVKRYAKIVAERYGERFIETGYKPLREFATVENGRTVRKPLIQFTLEVLFDKDEIEEIVIVGHQMLLEQRLGKFLAGRQKPWRIINQNTRLSAEIIERFNIKPRKVKHNSIAGNMIKGYAATRADAAERHALFVASDSPFTTPRFVDYFLTTAMAFERDNAIIIPAVLIEGHMDRFGRYPLKLINDTDMKLSDTKDNFGRQGYRLSSLLYGNPHGFDVNTANTAYNLRKCLHPKVQIKLFKITRNLGYSNVYSKFFMRKDLSLTEVEHITSAFFGGRLKIIPVRDVESSFDYDGTQDEYRRISDMLKHRSDNPAAEQSPPESNPTGQG
jgi:hypothetical protein